MGFLFFYLDKNIQTLFPIKWMKHRKKEKKLYTNIYVYFLFQSINC